MKRFVILAVLLGVFVAFAFAQDFTVTSVSGSVDRVSGTQRVAVKVGDTLAADTVINTGNGASLGLRAASGRAITVAESRNGTLAELTRGGVSVSGNVSRTNTDAVNRQTAGNATASARASDAAGDDDIAAE